MELDKDFKEFIELLNVHKVKYLIIGGYAVNFIARKFDYGEKGFGKITGLGGC